MTLLLGAEASKTPTETSVPNRKIYACQFVAIASGTVETITLKTSKEQKSLEAWFGIYRDNGNNFPGALLEQIRVNVLTGEQLVERSGFAIAVTGEHTYWLAAVATGGSRPLRPVIESGVGELNERTSVGHESPSLSEPEEREWEVLRAAGPEVFYGTGTLFHPHSEGKVDARQKGGNA